MLEQIKNVSCFHRDKIRKAINGLFTRKYTFRVVEEKSEDVI